MKNKNSKEKNTIVMICLLALAVCAIFAGTTYAFLTATLTGNDGLVNTFVSASGIIAPASEIPQGQDNDYNFNLKESKVKLENGAYVVDSSASPAYTKTNTYDNVVPRMSIYKDPMLNVNIQTGVSAYVYIEVVDSSNNFNYTIRSTWTELKDSSNQAVVGAQGGKVYVYNSGQPIVGSTHQESGNTVNDFEIENAYIITGNTITAKDSLTDDNGQLGTINFYAYVGQSSSFSSAAQAYTTLFPNS